MKGAWHEWFVCGTKGMFMQKIRVELTNLAPDAADRLMEVLRLYLLTESEISGSDEINMEVRDLSRRSLALPVRGGAQLRVPFENIQYVTSDRHWSILHLTNGTQPYRVNFSEIQQMLPEDEFLLCSRGILLNMRYIDTAQGDRFVMTDTAVFPIRRNGRKEILLRWEQYRLDHNPAQESRSR